MRKRAPAPEALGRRIKVHDRHQFELKLEYTPADERHASRYVVESFVCVPPNLNIGPDTVSRDALYSDIHNYVRLKTPELSWSELGALPASPLVRAADELERVEGGGDPSRFVYECKLLGCIFRARLRELALAAETALAGTVTQASVERLAALAADSCDAAASIAQRYRALAGRAEAPALPERARATFRLADEFMSVSVEHWLRRVVVSLASAGLAADGAAAAALLKRRLLQTILDEERYRQARGYASIIDPRTDNEPYIYRTSLLKKYCSSALFLAIRRATVRRRWQELAFAIAAGIAMSFATVFSLWAQSRFSGLGAQLFLLLVIGYMFKDRIKEGSRNAFSQLLQRSLFDRKVVIADPAGGKLGWCREKIDFATRSRLPPDAVAIRRRGMDSTDGIAEEELAVTVIHYRKEIVLRPPRLDVRSGGVGLTDILRFHVGRWTHEMDEPDQEIEYIDAETQALDPVRAAKTYHVDVVFRFHARPEQPPQTTLMRLILDRNGIKRIERTDASQG
jgi:hypothetical protein